MRAEGFGYLIIRVPGPLLVKIVRCKRRDSLGVIAAIAQTIGRSKKSDTEIRKCSKGATGLKDEKREAGNAGRVGL